MVNTGKRLKGRAAGIYMNSCSSKVEMLSEWNDSEEFGCARSPNTFVCRLTTLQVEFEVG